MDRTSVLETLRTHEPGLKAAGLLHLRLFGSVARNQADPLSDIDLLADFDRSRPVTLVTVGRLQIELSELLGTAVDLSSTDWMEEPALTSTLRESIVAF